MQQLALFDLGNNQPPVKYISNFLSSKEADKFYNYCQKLEWQQHNIKIMGKIMPVPRLECMYGDAGCNYLYSKSVLLEPLPWTDTLQELRSRIELKTGYKFNIVLCNRYRNGKDSVGWHNDNEPSMGISPAIASVSLGAERKFQLRLKNGGKPINFWLEHGSLLVMKPGCQENWVHQIPKTSLTVGSRGDEQPKSFTKIKASLNLATLKNVEYVSDDSHILLVRENKLLTFLFSQFFEQSTTKSIFLKFGIVLSLKIV